MNRMIISNGKRQRFVIALIRYAKIAVMSLHYICHNNCLNIPGTRVGPGFRDLMLAIKSKKNTRKSAFVKKLFKLN